MQKRYYYEDIWDMDYFYLHHAWFPRWKVKITFLLSIECASSNANLEKTSLDLGNQWLELENREVVSFGDIQYSTVTIVLAKFINKK